MRWRRAVAERITLRDMVNRPLSTRRVRVGLVLALLTTLGALRPAAPADTITVATYNIRHGRGMDERVDLARTAAAIRRLDADIVALQEVDRRVQRSGGDDQAAVLGELLDRHSAFGAFFPYQGGEYGMALLSRHPLDRVTPLRLPDGNEPRIALMAQLVLPSGARLQVVNVHFDWVRDDSLRVRQVDALAAVLDTVSLPMILLGDFNDVPESRTMRRWQSRFVALDKPADDPFTFSSTAPSKAIDHILLAPPSRWDGRSVRVITDTVTSDHRAVVGRVTLR
jgi:endonuclease/exonuclease/phosphatase family metal-dependent hydrolase